MLTGCDLLNVAYARHSAAETFSCNQDPLVLALLSTNPLQDIPRSSEAPAPFPVSEFKDVDTLSDLSELTDVEDLEHPAHMSTSKSSASTTSASDAAILGSKNPAKKKKRSKGKRRKKGKASTSNTTASLDTPRIDFENEVIYE